jgi:hypothetical protein
MFKKLIFFVVVAVAPARAHKSKSKQKLDGEAAALRTEDLNDERFERRHHSFVIAEKRRRLWGSHGTRFDLEQQVVPFCDPLCDVDVVWAMLKEPSMSSCAGKSWRSWSKNRRQSCRRRQRQQQRQQRRRRLPIALHTCLLRARVCVWSVLHGIIIIF